MNKAGTITWEAQEYVQHDKNAGWYAVVIAAGLALIALAILLNWWSFALLITVSVVALVVYAARPPRMLKYKLDNKGLLEGDRLYQYADYKSFGILQDGQHFAIVLTPRKRFSGRVIVFFPESQGEQIVDGFGARLPMEEVKLDLLDKAVKFLRI